MRCSFSIRAKRTWPSPPGPKPVPGETATSQSRTSSSANSTDPMARYGSGIRAQANIVPRGRRMSQPMRAKPSTRALRRDS